MWNGASRARWTRDLLASEQTGANAGRLTPWPMLLVQVSAAHLMTTSRDLLYTRVPVAFFLSLGPDSIGVVTSEAGAAGPWSDVLGHALVAKGSFDTEARDPSVRQIV